MVCVRGSRSMPSSRASSGSAYRSKRKESRKVRSSAMPLSPAHCASSHWLQANPLLEQTVYPWIATVTQG
jgi:hypothetical protein